MPYKATTAHTRGLAPPPKIASKAVLSDPNGSPILWEHWYDRYSYLIFESQGDPFLLIFTTEITVTAFIRKIFPPEGSYASHVDPDSEKIDQFF